MNEALLGLTSIFLLCMFSIALGGFSRKQQEKKEVHDKERLKQIRVETNQYLKEQGYKPKIKIQVKESSHDSFSTKSSKPTSRPKQKSNSSSNDEHHRRMEIIRNSNLGE
ncbi:hypothetical protein X915_gp062 [Bacillus phage vB_BanS-Tsamsa]|uniref:Uncharacterized protein n=1 Tax=Bacillus phage vB_BanS-Tsamsa TaxID=1308863 RepID=U5J9I3_9CAUD|nr:hypothetical protein X915_gp062 [Bacillus phage vB_BanS-Tsamsa]AGI11868.1 hypothetical protein [Bacillus phage vB_BanS-Tsamsa]